MSLEYILDLIIQYLLVEVRDRFISTVSTWFTKLLRLFRIIKSKTSAPFNSHMDILHQSEHFLVLNKPPDLLINSNDNSKNTVQTILRKLLPSLVNPSLRHEFYFAHRLDFSTSGILCIPLHKRACVALSKSFEQQKCEKFYIAIVNGHVNQAICDVNLEIGEDIRYETTSKRMCTARLNEVCKNPRKSQTRLVLLAHGMHNELQISKILLQPITGRRHQLRLHCSAIGHPILGDYTFGSPTDQTMPRMYLHAIRINAPNDTEDLHIETDDPFTDEAFGFHGELSPHAGVKMLRSKNN